MYSANLLYKNALQIIPGGVNASARYNAAIQRPFFISAAGGPFVYDLEGRQYIDFCTSHGAALLGHNHPQIKAAVTKALELGIACSYETEHQVHLAEKICELVPCAEMVRFSLTGTETIIHALRLARAATGREKIIKFEGHFHGYSDDLYFSVSPPIHQAGPADAPHAYPHSAGIPRQNSERLIVVPFNNPTVLIDVFEQYGAETAALILEPINYDNGCIIPQPGFLQLCRELCDRYGVLLFFDEVLTAFRMAPGGAQEYLGVIPDLAVIGKAIGAGMPISAIVGRRAVMQHLRPVGESEHSGTYLAHLTAVLAAQAALEIYSSPGFYEHVAKISASFYQEFQSIIDRVGVPLRLQHVGPRFGLYFGITSEVINYRQAAAQNRALFVHFVDGCIRRGVYFHISPHHGFSAVHKPEHFSQALEAIEQTLLEIRADR